MTNLLSRLCLFLFGLLFLGCGGTQKIAALKPEADDASPLLYDNVSSFISLPISIKLKDIENQSNKLLNGLIYEDTSIDDDNYTVKVWKQAPINLVNENGKIKTILPLKAIVNYRYGIDKFGITLFDTREISLNGTIILLSDVALSNWKLNTATEFKSLNWKESPTIAIAGKNIAITYLINPALKLFKSKIEKSIDEAIKKSMDFKPNVLDALEKICTPSEMSADYESWLRIVPVELYTTDAVLKKDAITLDMGLKCTIET